GPLSFVPSSLFNSDDDEGNKELGTRNQELEQPPRYGSHPNRRPEFRIKSIGWPPSIDQSPSTLRDTPTISKNGEDGSQRKIQLANVKSVVMIQCVGCREEGRNYCGRVCCSQALKNALKLKEKKPETAIYILYRDMRSYGFREDYYRLAADREVRFIPWDETNRPLVETAISEEGKSVVRVTVADAVLGSRLELDADLLVLSAAPIPSAASQEAARMFKVALGPDGFFQEAHVKLRPVDFAADGVFHCGTAHYPKHIAESVCQAYGAAGRAAALLSRDTVTASGSVCDVKESACVSCGACIAVCTYGAIEFRETAQGRKAFVNSVLCKGDGLCNAVCPTSAISLRHYTDEQLLSQIDAATEENRAKAPAQDDDGPPQDAGLATGLATA
ncbi:MAG: 4Fe-4S dicluster domain-containing protein, partial [Pseudomonadota bacterium]